MQRLSEDHSKIIQRSKQRSICCRCRLDLGSNLVRGAILEANGDHNGIHIVKAVEFNNSTIQGTSDGTDVIARPLEAIEVELKVVG